MAKKTWVYSPPKPSKPRVPDSIKKEVTGKAVDLIESVLKPTLVKQPLISIVNYLVDIPYKWNRNYFYFMKKYNCPNPDAIPPSFEVGFARLEYIGEDNITYLILGILENGGKLKQNCLWINAWR